ncbi:MAG TPA: dihydropteroate synthase, partial [Phnomibacter sp.]|nr:dihydropteroate synthase [Phnomibacter sp.]
MGILNITPDSFYQQSRMGSVQQAVDAAGQMALEGATFIDIGGQSTRPGATLLPWQQEAERIVPVVAAIAKHIPQVFISVDTFYAPVAKAGVEAGAHLINDVSAG